MRLPSEADRAHHYTGHTPWWAFGHAFFRCILYTVHVKSVISVSVRTRGGVIRLWDPEHSEYCTRYSFGVYVLEQQVSSSTVQQVLAHLSSFVFRRSPLAIMSRTASILLGRTAPTLRASALQPARSPCLRRGFAQETAFPKPLKLRGVLKPLKQFDVTPTVGTEFPEANLVDMLHAPNADELLRDLAITSKRAQK